MENRLQNQKQDTSTEVQSRGNCESLTRNNDQWNDLWGQSSSAVGVKIESGLETAHIKLELDDADSRTTSESPPREIDQLEPLIRNDSNVFESETVLEFCIKEEEDDAEFDEYGSVIDTLSKENLQCDEQVSLLRNSQDVPYKICNIKQEEVEDDNGIIGGFLENFEDDVLLENEYNMEKMMQEQFESHYPQLETTKSPAIPSYIDKRLTKCEESTVSLRPELSPIASTADGEMNQNFERNAPQDVSTMQDEGTSSNSILLDNHPDIAKRLSGHTSNWNINAWYGGQHSSQEQDQFHISQAEFNDDSVVNLIDLRSALKQLKRIEDGQKDHSCEGNEDTSTNIATSSGVPLHDRHHPKDKIYSCDICGKSFRRSKLFEMHKRLHTREKTYSCDVCKEIFFGPKQLEIHKRIHTGEKPYSCDICQKRFHALALCRKHRRDHCSEGASACELCGRSFSFISGLKRHRLLHSKYESYPCDDCEKVFVRKLHLDRHKRVHKGEKPFKCEICKKRFKTTEILETHKLTHLEKRGYLCSVCGKHFLRKEQLELHKPSHVGEDPCSCEICRETFKTLGDLKKHRRTHSEKRGYSCSECGKEFRQQRQLSSHKRSHLREKTFLCEICKAGFKTLEELNSHKLTHIKRRSYSCGVCGSQFSQIEQLKEHTTLHTEDRPYSCVICEERFMSWASCKEHEQEHTEIGPFRESLERPYGGHEKEHTGYRPFHESLERACEKGGPNTEDLMPHELTQLENKPSYPCDLRGKTYNDRALFERHEHADGGKSTITCEVCKEDFKSQVDLNAHKATHSEKSPLYSCLVCGKRFCNGEQLVEHGSLHTGKKPYSCDICKETFWLAVVCEEHKKRHDLIIDYFRCEICGKSFKTLQDLDRHGLSHSNGKMYSCEICATAFDALEDLNTHKFAHSTEKTNSCDVCGEQFKQKQHLEMHKSKHVEEKTPYSFAITNKRIKRSDAYLDHENGVSREGSLLCVVCGESFGSLVSLNTHKLTHLEGNCYSCNVCGSQFPLNEQLKDGCPICKSRLVSLNVCTEHEKRDIEEWPSFCEIRGVGFETH